MEEIAEALQGIGYEGKCSDIAVLDDALQNGVKSEAFRSTIGWIANELSVLASLEEQINETREINDFLLELSAFLKEIGCPYPKLVTGPISNRFQSQDERILLLQFLISELMAWKMFHKLNPPEPVVIEIVESKPAAALKSIMLNLNLGKPPENVAPKAVFEKIYQRVDEAIKRNGLVPKALFEPGKPLTADQWTKLERLQHELDAEYDLRRDMLITRLDVTVQSFHWSENIKNKGDEMAEKYTNKRKELDFLKHGGKTTDIVEVLASREDIVIIDKTSSANVRQNTQTDIQKHVIGRVPDRGGRAREHAPPPPEMPFWQQQRSSGGGGNQGRGGFNQPPQQQRNFNQQKNFRNQPSGGNPHRGNNRVQGGWSQSGAGGRDYNRQSSDNGGGQYQKSQGAYNQYGGGHQQQQQGGYGGQYQGGNDRERNHQSGNDRGGYQGNADRGGRSSGYSNYNRGGGGGGRRY